MFRRLQENIKTYPKQEAYCCLVTEIDRQLVRFHVTNNEGQSSSILEFDDSKMQSEYPGLKVDRVVGLEARRLDSFLKENTIDLSHCNLLNVDVQGFELPVLKSLGGLLERFDAICAEVNLSRVYRGATLLHELERFLVAKGFIRVWLSISGSQGEAWYVHRRPRFYNRIRTVITAHFLELMALLRIIDVVMRNKAFALLRRLYYKSKKKDMVSA